MKDGFKKINDIIRKVKDLTVVGIGNVIANAITGIFWIYLASIITTEEYGEISYFIAIASIASVISFLGVGNTIVIYTAKKIPIQSTVSLISSVSSIVVSIVLFLIFYNLGVSLYIIGYVIFGIAIHDVLGNKLYKDYSKFFIIQRILLVVFALLLYYIFGYQGIIIGFALSFFPFIIHTFKVLKKSKIDFGLFKPKFGFMMNSYSLDISKVFSNYTDRLIIFSLFGFALLGNYQLGIQFLMVLSILPTVVFTYMLPQEASKKGHKKIWTLTILISGVMTILTMFLAPSILPALIPKYEVAIEIIQILSLAIVPISINFMYTSKFLSLEKSKFVAMASGLYLIIQISGIFTLSDLLGINGVAYSLVIAAVVQAIFFIITFKLYAK